MRQTKPGFKQKVITSLPCLIIHYKRRLWYKTSDISSLTYIYYISYCCWIYHGLKKKGKKSEGFFFTSLWKDSMAAFIWIYAQTKCTLLLTKFPQHLFPTKDLKIYCMSVSTLAHGAWSCCFIMALCQHITDVS